MIKRQGVRGRGWREAPGEVRRKGGHRRWGDLNLKSNL